MDRIRIEFIQFYQKIRPRLKFSILPNASHCDKKKNIKQFNVSCKNF